MGRHVHVTIQHPGGGESCEIIDPDRAGSEANVWAYWFTRPSSGLVFKIAPADPNRKVYPYGSILSYEVEVIEDVPVPQEVNADTLSVRFPRDDAVWSGHIVRNADNAPVEKG